jgi:hypothetical protein
MTERTQIWSSGGGVQSTAIAVMILRGDLPAPDLAVIVDTTRERATTWEYLDRYTAPALAQAGVKLERVSAADYASTDLFEGAKQRLLIPAYTLDTSERGGKLTNQCSSRWKRRVAQRWARAQGVNRAEVWIGISTDELSRRRLSREKWWIHRYPLIDARMNRADCYGIIRRHGWPEPPKSSCWMCPHMKPSEWRGLHSADWKAALDLDAEMRRTKNNAYLTADMEPLSEIDFTESQESLFTECESGWCFV